MAPAGLDVRPHSAKIDKENGMEESWRRSDKNHLPAPAMAGRLAVEATNSAARIPVQYVGPKGEPSLPSDANEFIRHGWFSSLCFPRHLADAVSKWCHPPLRVACSRQGSVTEALGSSPHRLRLDCLVLHRHFLDQPSNVAVRLVVVSSRKSRLHTEVSITQTKVKRRTTRSAGQREAISAQARYRIHPRQCPTTVRHQRTRLRP